MAEPAPAPPLIVTPTEFFWLTAGLWLGGACLLALLPVLLMSRLSPAGALAVSYLAFFITWQPLQRMTQRALGPRRAMVRMLALVASAAMLAYYVREALLALIRGTAA